MIDERKRLADTLRMYAQAFERLDTEAERTEEEKTLGFEVIYTAIRCGQWLEKYADVGIDTTSKEFLIKMLKGLNG